MLKKNSKDNGNKSQCKIFIIPLNKVKWGIFTFSNNDDGEPTQHNTTTNNYKMIIEMNE